jgi:hypothetical protein
MNIFLNAVGLQMVETFEQEHSECQRSEIFLSYHHYENLQQSKTGVHTLLNTH